MNSRTSEIESHNKSEETLQTWRNLASETTVEENRVFLEALICIQVSNYTFDICKFGALFELFYRQQCNKLKGLNWFFCYIPFPPVLNFDYYI